MKYLGIPETTTARFSPNPNRKTRSNGKKSATPTDTLFDTAALFRVRGEPETRPYAQNRIGFFVSALALLI